MSFAKDLDKVIVDVDYCVSVGSLCDFITCMVIINNADITTSLARGSGIFGLSFSSSSP